MDKLIFLYLILFPFGKLTGPIPDLIVLLIVLVRIFKSPSNIKINNLIIVFVFSLIFSLSLFNLPQLLTGFLYLIRFIIYILFSQIKLKKKLLFNSLIAVGISIAIFGWIQYLFFPDLRALKALGWDDHYFRLVSTFLDPAFTGILLVLSEILVLIKTLKNKTKLLLFANIFLVFTILFTYSRSSYIALFFVLFFLFWKFRQKFIILLVSLFLFIPLLPHPGGEGVNLARTYSAVDKFTNYKESFSLIQRSPIFGIGFNNVCIATSNNFFSHSCSGLDNSLLFIIATTGIFGVIFFFDFIYQTIKNTKLDNLGWGLIASLIAVFIHGMFTNTWFYNFILGWIAILISITRKNYRA